MKKNLNEYQLINLGNYIEFKLSNSIDELGFNSAYSLVYDLGYKRKVVELQNASMFSTYYDMTYDVADSNKTKLLRIYIKNREGGFKVFPIIYNLRDGSIINTGNSYDLNEDSCGPFHFCKKGCCYYISPKIRKSVYANINISDLFLVIYQGLLQNKFLTGKTSIARREERKTKVQLRAYSDITLNVMKFLL